MSLEVGQKLYYVPSNRGGIPKEVVVTKIGRKWATIDKDWGSQKINLESMYADGGQYSSPGRCYLSKEDYESAVSLEEAWSKFRNILNRTGRVPDNLTEEDIRYAYEVLKIDPQKYK